MAKSRSKRDWPRWKRRAAVGVAVAVALLVMAGLGPTFVNLGLGRESIRRAIQRRVEPDVEFADLRVGWFGSQRINGLTLTGDDGREIAKLDGRIDRGLLGLALGVGRLHLAVTGVLRTALRADGSLGLADDLAPRRRGSAAAGRAGPPLGGVPAGTLALEGLRVELLDEVSGQPATLESLTGSIRYQPGDLVDLALSSPTSFRGEAGSISVAAKLRGLVSERGYFTPWAASGDVEIAAAHVAVPLSTRNIVLRSARLSAATPSLRDRLTLEVAAEAVIDGSLHGSAQGKIIALSPIDEEGYLDLSLDRLAGQIKASRMPTAPLQLLLPAGTPLRMDLDVGATIDLDASFTDRVTVRVRSDAIQLDATGGIDRATGRVAGDTLHLAASLGPELIVACTGIAVAEAVPFEVTLDSFSLPRDPIDAAFSGAVEFKLPNAIQVPGGSASVPVGPARIGLRSEGLRRGVRLEGRTRIAGGDATLELDLAGLVAAEDDEAPKPWLLGLEPLGSLTIQGLDLAVAARLLPSHEALVAAVAEGPVNITVRSEKVDQRLTATVRVAGPGIDVRAEAAREGSRFTIGPVQSRGQLTAELARAVQAGLAEPVTVIDNFDASIDVDPMVLTVADPEAPDAPAAGRFELPDTVSGRVAVMDLSFVAGAFSAEPLILKRFNAAVRLDQSPVPALVASGTAHFRTVEGGQMIGSLRFKGQTGFGEEASQSAQLELRDLSVHGIERLIGWGPGELSQWFGPGGWGSVELVRRGPVLDLTIAPTFPRVAGRFQFTMDQQAISLVAERTTATVDREVLQRRMSPKSGAAAVTVRNDVPLSLAMRLRLPRPMLAQLLPERLGGALGFDAGETFDPAAVRVDAELSGGPLELVDRSGATSTLRSAVLKLASDNLAQGVTLTMTGQVEHPGGKSGTIRADGGLVGLVKKNTLARDGAGLDLAAEARQVPTAIVDALCAWNGLLVAAMGDRFDGEASASRFWLDHGTIGLKVRSPGATLEGNASGRGRGEGGAALVIGPAAPLEATLELTPALRERLLSRIHPLLADVRTVEQRPKMKVVAATVPLDGDPARLDADLEVTIGKVELDSGSLGLALLAAAHASNAATLPGEIEPIRARIRKGILTYDRFAVHLDKYTFVYSGQVDLVAGTVDLRTEVPLAGLAQSVKELRGYADQIVVPLVTRGRFGALRTEIDPDFDLVGAALQAGFRGGLGELLKDATKDANVPIDDIFDGIFGRKKK